MNIEIKKSIKPINYFNALKLLETRLERLSKNMERELIWTLEHDEIFTAGTSYLENEIIDKKIKVDDLVVGDKNSLLVGCRILGYGKDYEIQYGGNTHVIDLSILENKPFDETSIEQGKNEFSFTIPSNGSILTYKLLTGKDEKAIDREINGLKKVDKDASPELTTRLKNMILSVDGNEEKKDIRDFVDNYFLARDSRAFREHIKNTQPDVDLTYILDSGEEVDVI